MSKSVRLKTYLAEEVERLAAEEKRSFANMVEILLEQALKLEVQPVTRESVQTEPVYVQVQAPSTPRQIRRDAEVRTDFK